MRLTLNEVITLCTRSGEVMSRRTLYRRMEGEGFPRPTLTRGVNLWLESEVREWLARQFFYRSNTNQARAFIDRAPEQDRDRLWELWEETRGE